MRPTRFLWVGAAGALALVVITLSGNPRPGVRQPAPQPALDPRIESLEAGLERVASRLEDLDRVSERLNGLEAGIGALRSRAVPTSTRRAGPDVERLLETAKALSADPARRADAFDAWARVAETATEPGRRAEAWFEQSKLCDVSMAAELLARVIETVGLESKLGQDAAYRLGYCQHGNVSESMRIWRELAKAPNLPRELAARTRIMAAHMAVTHCEYDLAIEEYDRIITDYQDDPNEKCREVARWAAGTRQNVIQRR
jgi:hypothetical protein